MVEILNEDNLEQKFYNNCNIAHLKYVAAKSCLTVGDDDQLHKDLAWGDLGIGKEDLEIMIERGEAVAARVRIDWANKTIILYGFSKDFGKPNPEGLDLAVQIWQGICGSFMVEIQE